VTQALLTHTRYRAERAHSFLPSRCDHWPPPTAVVARDQSRRSIHARHRQRRSLPLRFDDLSSPSMGINERSIGSWTNSRNLRLSRCNKIVQDVKGTIGRFFQSDIPIQGATRNLDVDEFETAPFATANLVGNESDLPPAAVPLKGSEIRVQG
jgi:hypothetical protein